MLHRESLLTLRTKTQNSLPENTVDAFFPTGRQDPYRKPEDGQTKVTREERNEAVCKGQFLCPAAASQGNDGSHTCRKQNRQPQKRRGGEKNVHWSQGTLDMYSTLLFTY